MTTSSDDSVQLESAHKVTTEYSLSPAKPLTSSCNESSAKIATEFPLFPKLPTELQHMIWKFVAHQPRVIAIQNIHCHGDTPRNRMDCLISTSDNWTPAILQVNAESRKIGLKFYSLRSAMKPSKGQDMIYLNFSVDIIYLASRISSYDYGAPTLQWTNHLRSADWLSDIRYLALPASRILYSSRDDLFNEYVTRNIFELITNQIKPSRGFLEELILVDDSLIDNDFCRKKNHYCFKPRVRYMNPSSLMDYFPANDKMIHRYLVPLRASDIIEWYSCERLTRSAPGNAVLIKNFINWFRERMKKCMEDYAEYEELVKCFTSMEIKVMQWRNTYDNGTETIVIEPETKFSVNWDQRPPYLGKLRKVEGGGWKLVRA